MKITNTAISVLKFPKCGQGPVPFLSPISKISYAEIEIFKSFKKLSAVSTICPNFLEKNIFLLSTRPNIDTKINERGLLLRSPEKNR